MLKPFDHRRARERPVGPLISARRACHIVRRPARNIVGAALASHTTAWFGRTNRDHYDLQAILQFALHGRDVTIRGPVPISTKGIDTELRSLRLPRAPGDEISQPLLTYLDLFIRQSGRMYGAWFRHRDSWSERDGLIIVATHSVRESGEGDDIRVFVIEAQSKR